MCFVLLIELDYFLRIWPRADVDEPADWTTTTLEAVFLNNGILRKPVTKYARNALHRSRDDNTETPDGKDRQEMRCGVGKELNGA